MPDLRIAMVAVPALLADIIRRGLNSRIEGVTITELANLQHTSARLREINPDVVIVGPAAHPTDARLILTLLPHARVLAVSDDLSQLIDLDTGEHEALTADALTERLRR